MRAGSAGDLPPDPLPEGKYETTSLVDMYRMRGWRLDNGFRGRFLPANSVDGVDDVYVDK